MGDGTVLARLEGVTFRHPLPDGGERTAVEDVDLEVRAGETLVVLGAAGAGKTTLASLIAGVLHPARGKVLRPGPPSADLPHLPVGLLTENPEDSFTCPVVREEMAVALQGLDREERQIDLAVEEMLRETGLEEMAGAHPFLLSGGQKQLLAAASLLVSDPLLLVLDDPLSLLDHRSREEVSRLLDRRRARGAGAVVYLSSDVGDALRGGRTAVLSGGRKVWEGASRDLPLDDATLGSWGLRAPELTRLLSALFPGERRLLRPGELAELLCRSL